MYQVFEHTADLGLKVEAESLEQLFCDAARGLTSILVANLQDVRPVEERLVEVESEPVDYLLFDWLNELLYLFESEHLLFGQFEVQVDERRLHARCRGERMDRTRHDMEHEVKAITYHGLSVEQVEKVWRAELIVDI